MSMDVFSKAHDIKENPITTLAGTIWSGVKYGLLAYTLTAVARIDLKLNGDEMVDQFEFYILLGALVGTVFGIAGLLSAHRLINRRQ